MPLCSLTVHQLRYYLAFGTHASARLDREGHAYLATVEPFALLAAATALGALVGRLTRAWSGRDAVPAEPNRIVRTWALCAVALLALYCGQELAEGVFASGHPAGIAAIVGHGGVIAAPLALLVAAALALALRTVEELIGLAARRSRYRRGTNAPDRVPLPRPAQVHGWRLDPRSGAVSDRAPPSWALPTLA
jgi:hypothetical protein